MICPGSLIVTLRTEKNSNSYIVLQEMREECQLFTSFTVSMIYVIELRSCEKHNKIS